MASVQEDGRTIVHLVRHGEVDNPGGVLYGRLPDFHLSERGRAMADRLAEHFAPQQGEIVALRCSPLERAQETMAPIAHALNLPVVTDGRVIEAANRLEGHRVGMNASLLKAPHLWPLLLNPFQPSWGEPYRHIVARMQTALRDSAAAAPGRAAVVVSHQLPIWVARLAAEGRRLWHDPRKRECTLASVTTFTLIQDRVVSVSYAEPAGDLLPQAEREGFVAGA